MKDKRIAGIVRGQPGRDGAGVNLTRVLHTGTLEAFDPFLMLDSFDSKDPADYINGFPEHPHRGIETITYLAEGRIDHKDSLGNAGSIRNGDAQWMTAGSGILHEEMPQPAERMLGLQFWLNLPQKDKMTTPKYFDIHSADIPVVQEEGATVRVIAGSYKDTIGAQSHHIPATFLELYLEANSEVRFPSASDETSFVFLLEGDAVIGEKTIAEKAAVLLEDGDHVRIQSTDQPARVIYAQAPPLGEPIAWGGPIVMNTKEEITQAFMDLRNGNFIKDQPES
ncbi:MAG: pirin family protein [Bacillota bacterium]|jgi:redox-sensitive bicupin YhaK (pirin superfamily)|nr:pirin family protein [Bacillota bacterium]